MLFDQETKVKESEVQNKTQVLYYVVKFQLVSSDTTLDDFINKLVIPVRKSVLEADKRTSSIELLIEI